MKYKTHIHIPKADLLLVLALITGCASTAEQLIPVSTPTPNHIPTRIVTLGLDAGQAFDPSPTAIPPNFGTEEHPLTDHWDILRAIKELLVRNQHFLQQPGWVHLRYRTFKDSAPQQAFPPILKNQETHEEWLHVLNNQGEFVEYLNVSNDMNGNELQRLVVGPDGWGGNISLIRQGLAEASPPASANKPQKMEHIHSYIDQMLYVFEHRQPAGCQRRAWQEAAGEKPAVFILQQECMMTEPIVVENYPEPIVATFFEARFYMKNGQIISNQSWTALGDGQTFLDSALEFDTVEVLEELPVSTREQFDQSLEILRELTGRAGEE